MVWCNGRMLPPPIAIPIVGEPMTWIIGAAVLALVLLTGTWAESLVTVVHEGGHVMVGVLTGRNPKAFKVNENTGGGLTSGFDGRWGPGVILLFLAGYLTPPLAGLAGASALRAGLTWPALMSALFLLLGAWAKAQDLFTHLIVVVAGAGIGWVALGGDPVLQAVVAIGLVWLMLIGGIRSLWHLRWGGGTSDAGQLARLTWIPSILWVALFWSVALLCLWAGARRLLGI